MRIISAILICMAVAACEPSEDKAMANEVTKAIEEKFYHDVIVENLKFDIRRNDKDGAVVLFVAEISTVSEFYEFDSMYKDYERALIDSYAGEDSTIQPKPASGEFRAAQEIYDNALSSSKNTVKLNISTFPVPEDNIFKKLEELMDFAQQEYLRDKARIAFFPPPTRDVLMARRDASRARFERAMQQALLAVNYEVAKKMPLDQRGTLIHLVQYGIRGDEALRQTADHHDAINVLTFLLANGGERTAMRITGSDGSPPLIKKDPDLGVLMITNRRTFDAFKEQLDRIAKGVSGVMIDEVRDKYAAEGRVRPDEIELFEIVFLEKVSKIGTMFEIGGLVKFKRELGELNPFVFQIVESNIIGSPAMELAGENEFVVRGSPEFEKQWKRAVEYYKEKILNR